MSSSDIFERGLAIVGGAAIVGVIYVILKRKENKEKKELEEKKASLVGNRDIQVEINEITAQNESLADEEKVDAYVLMNDISERMSKATTAKSFEEAYKDYQKYYDIFKHGDHGSALCAIGYEKEKKVERERNADRKIELEKNKAIVDAIIFANRRPATIINNNGGNR